MQTNIDLLWKRGKIMVYKCVDCGCYCDTEHLAVIHTGKGDNLCKECLKKIEDKHQCELVLDFEDGVINENSYPM